MPAQHLRCAAMQALPVIPEDFEAPDDAAEDSQQQGTDSADARQAGSGQETPGQQQQARSDAQQQANSASSGSNDADSEGAAAGASSSGAEAPDAVDAALLSLDAVQARAAATAEMVSNGTDAAGSGSSTVHRTGGSAKAPALNATEAAQIDFDDMGVDNETPQGGFLARLTDSFSGALGGIFS